MADTGQTFHRSMVLVNVEDFGARNRTERHQVSIHAGMYEALQEAVRAVGVPWEACHQEDHGDGVLVLLPPEYPTAPLVEAMPGVLVRALQEHNRIRPSAEHIRLRMAVHAGDVTFDEHGVSSPALNTAFRLLDASAVKTALAESPDPVALVVSDLIYDEVVCHSLMLAPATFRRVLVRTKEVDRTAWIARPSRRMAGADPAFRVFVARSSDVSDAFARAVGPAVLSMGGVLTEEVSDADVVIVLAGFAHDSAEQIFLTAGELGVPRLVFLLDPKLATTHDAKQAGFRTRLLDSGAVTSVVDSPEALAATVTVALTDLRPPVTSPRRVSNLPPRPQRFVERDEMALLRDMLRTSPNRVTITGEPGAGKSTLALEYAHRFAHDYTIIWWIPALSEKLVQDSVADLLSASRDEVGGQGNWLVIADGAADPAAIWRLLPDGGHILVTSSQSVEVDHGLRITSFSRSETWSASMERLDDTARQLLSLCAWIAPTPLSISMLAANPSSVPAALWSPEGLAAAAATLREAALARVDTDTVVLPAPLAELVRDQTKDEVPGPGGWPAVAVNLLSHADPASRRGRALLDVTAADRPLGPAPAVVRDLLDQLVERESDLPWELADNAIRYARASTAARERDTLQRLRSEPNQAAIAAAQRELGDYAAAVDTDEQHLAELSQTLGPDHPDTLAQAVSLATTLRDLDDHQRARDLASGTRERARQVLGHDHPVTLAAAVMLAAIYREQGEYEWAQALDKDALDRCERLLGTHHPRTLQTATALASDLALLGHHEQARELNERTLEWCRHVLGANHPDTLLCAVNLAADYAELNKSGLAINLGEDTLRRYRRTLGDDHPDTRLCAANVEQDRGKLPRRLDSPQSSQSAASRVSRRTELRGLLEPLLRLTEDRGRDRGPKR